MVLTTSQLLNPPYDRPTPPLTAARLRQTRTTEYVRRSGASGAIWPRQPRPGPDTFTHARGFQLLLRITPQPCCLPPVRPRLSLTRSASPIRLLPALQ